MTHAEIVQLINEYNAACQEQADRLTAIYNAVKERRGHREVRFGRAEYAIGAGWMDFNQDTVDQFGDRVNKFTLPIYDYRLGSEQ